MGLVQKPGSTILTLDGFDDQASIDNSGLVGSVFDNNYNTPFSWVLGIEWSSFSNTPTGFYYIMQKGNIPGFWFAIALPEKQIAFGFNHGGTGVSYYVLTPFASHAMVAKTPYIIGFTTAGTNNLAGFNIYVHNGNTGALITSAKAIGGTASTNNLKNTSPLVFKMATGAPFTLKNFTAWDRVLSQAEVADLALRMIAGTVKDHAAYSANNVTFLQYVTEKSWVNTKNKNLNATILRP
jgi:hypothetical protein